MLKVEKYFLRTKNDREKAVRKGFALGSNLLFETFWLRTGKIKENIQR